MFKMYTDMEIQPSMSFIGASTKQNKKRKKR